MRRCGPKCAKWSTVIVSLVALVLGIVLALFWGKLFDKIVNRQLSVAKNDTKGFQMWQETPIPMYLEFHMFNWTNPHLVETHSVVKPAFTEMGPYVFYEHHIRENITFNDNGTITYLNKRIWRFEPDKSAGGLDDVITILNPIAIVVTNHIKDEHYLVKRAVNFFLEEKKETIALQKTIRELLFDGYDDTLIDIAFKLNISGLKLPFKKFGWFVDRNGSASYDGVFNMYDGGKDISKLGVITEWNYEHQTSYYPGKCGIVDGTSGELWYAPHNDEEVAIFASDLCSKVKLHRNGTKTLFGVEGHQFVAHDDIFDNGTYYASTSCFASGMPTGVRGVSACKFGAPAYMSLPHFYLADPIYANEVDGLNPNPLIHSTQLSLEPNTGIPVSVYAAFQLNLLMRNMPGIEHSVMEVVRHIERQVLRIHSLTCLITRLFSNQFLIMVMFAFCSGIHCCLFSYNYGTFDLGVIYILYSIPIFVCIYICDVTHKSARKVATSLLALSTCFKEDGEVYETLKDASFTIQLLQRDFMAARFFSVDRKIVMSLLSAIGTYFLFMQQMYFPGKLKENNSSYLGFPQKV